MAFWNKENKETKKSNSYSIHVPANVMSEAMKGQTINVSDSNSNKQLIGEPHPFDYNVVEGVCNEFGLISAFTDKLINQVWCRGFSTEAKDPRDKEIIDNWVQDTGFTVIGREWVATAIEKGTSYLELSGKETEVPQEIKTLNPQRVFIKRDDKGSTVKYLQQRIEKGKVTNEKPIEFKPYEIACLKINPPNEDSAYGLGIVYPNLKTINYFLGNQKDLHDLIKRKANTPLVATLGNREKDEYPSAEDISSFGANMTYMNSKTEWAIGDNVRLSTVDFGDVGKNFDAVLRNDFELLMFGFQTPEALLGQGNIAEGLGGVQMDGYDRYAQAFQSIIERVIENQIFTRVLRANRANKRDGKVQLIWGQPSKGELNARISALNTLLSNMTISSGLRMEAEKKLARLLDIDTDKLTTPKESSALTISQPQPKVPGSNESYEGKVYIGRKKNGKHSHD